MITETDVYHYTECGLPNVWIQGAIMMDEDGEETVRIPNPHGLHRLIARKLVESEGRLTGAELRFLRSEMGLTRTQLGVLLHRERPSVSRWESGRTRIDGATEALVRIYATIKLELEPVDDAKIEEISARCVTSAHERDQLRIDGTIPGSYRLVA